MWQLLKSLSYSKCRYTLDVLDGNNIITASATVYEGSSSNAAEIFYVFFHFEPVCNYSLQSITNYPYSFEYQYMYILCSLDNYLKYSHVKEET